jgi:hypothetical protein
VRFLLTGRQCRRGPGCAYGHAMALGLMVGRVFRARRTLADFYRLMGDGRDTCVPSTSRVPMC